MRVSIWGQVTGIGSLSTLSELSEVLLRLQVLLAEADLSVLSIPTPSAHHAAIVRDCVHAVRSRTVRRVARLLAKVLVARWQLAIVARR